MAGKKVEASKELSKALDLILNPKEEPRARVETREVGDVREIEAGDLLVVYHKSGNPAEQAVMLRELMARGLDQRGIAKLLEISQGQISRTLRLLKLTPALFERVLRGEVKAWTGYQLSRLPESEQRRFEGMEKVTMKSAEEAVRELVLNKDVVALVKEDDREACEALKRLPDDSGFPDPGEGNRAPEGQFALLDQIHELLGELGVEGMRAVRRYIDERLGQ